MAVAIRHAGLEGRRFAQALAKVGLARRIAGDGRGGGNRETEGGGQPGPEGRLENRLGAAGGGDIDLNAAEEPCRAPRHMLLDQPVREAADLVNGVREILGSGNFGIVQSAAAKRGEGQHPQFHRLPTSFAKHKQQRHQLIRQIQIGKTGASRRQRNFANKERLTGEKRIALERPDDERWALFHRLIAKPDP